MTQREFFNAVIAETQNTEIAEFATNALHKMDERNAKRSATPSKTAVANEPIKAEIVKVLTAEPMTASEIAKAVGVSTQKCSALLRQIEGLEVTEVKVKGRGKVKGYSLG